jgi:adhesin transport system membrane fusion protein
VISISADAMPNKETGTQYYQVDVSLRGTLYEDNGEEVVILPGMVASIDVLSGKRTILDYFWQPITKTRDKAFRE